MNLLSLRYRRFHASYLLGWLAAAILLGLWLGKAVALGDSALWLMIILILILGAFHSRRWWAVGCVVIAGLLLGCIRGAEEAGRYALYDSLHGQTIEMRGTMVGDAQRTASGQQKLSLSNISIHNQQYVGEVFVTLYTKTDLKRGDTLTVRGSLEEGFASYAALLKNGTVLHIERGNDVIRDVRERFANVIRSVMIEPMASLGLGFVVGQRSTLPDELDEQLKIVGLTHIVVASGYNLTILARFVMRLLAHRSRYLALVGSLLVVFGFVLFSGFSPSMNRAVIVTSLSLLAWYVGRRFHPLLLIVYVAAGTAFFNPVYVWSDLGWYLSFFAFAGILIVAPLIVRALYKKRSPSSVEQLVLETVSAELMALPLIALAFSTLPVFGLIANVLVAPLIPAAMALTALTGVGGMISTSLGAVLAMPTNVLIGYMIAVIEWLSAFQIAQYHIDLGLGFVLLWYGVLVVVGLLLWRRTGYNFRKSDEKLEM